MRFLNKKIDYRALSKASQCAVTSKKQAAPNYELKADKYSLLLLANQRVQPLVLSYKQQQRSVD
jgi:hypothetical protein